MSVTVIRTKDRIPYRPLYHAFEDKHFSHDFPCYTPSWSDSPFLFASFTLDDSGAVGSFANLILTEQKTYEKLLDGSLKETEIEPFAPGAYGIPYLYWTGLIIENRPHAPYLLKSVFREIEECARQWELTITHVYSIAFTKVSERLMRRYYFNRAGVYSYNSQEYPIMISKVSDNPYLRAFLPVS